MTPTKETNKNPTTDPKEMMIYVLFDKTFSLTILKKFSGLSNRQLTENRKTMHKQNKKFNKETETIKKKP